MQTFLPYPDFDESAAVLDSPRLGKQRVETLQLLRALVFPSYGWQNHPAKVMWEGYIPALARYGLAMVDAWTERGAGDSTRSQIAEFAPGVADLAEADLELPSWLGNESLHRSHQSNLIRKDPVFYGPRFPGVPGDLEYVWPGADPGVRELSVAGDPLVILRPRDSEQLADWVESGGVTLGEDSPRGTRGPKWIAQLESFSRLPVGTRFAAIDPSGGALVTGEFTSEIVPFRDAREAGVRRAARFIGDVNRADFPYPALLQDPRTLFETVGPRL